MASYVLIMEIEADCCPVVGARGPVDLRAGIYLYIGSARRAWQKRVARHLRSEKKLRWHIDYILAEPHCTIREVWITPQDCECATAKDVLQLPDISLPGPRLGASDCRCSAHFMGLKHGIKALPLWALADFPPCHGGKWMVKSNW